MTFSPHTDAILPVWINVYFLPKGKFKNIESNLLITNSNILFCLVEGMHTSTWPGL